LSKGPKEKYIIIEEASLKNILLDKNNIEMMDAFNETISNYQKFYIKLQKLLHLIKPLPIPMHQINP